MLKASGKEITCLPTHVYAIIKAVGIRNLECIRKQDKVTSENQF